VWAYRRAASARWSVCGAAMFRNRYYFPSYGHCIVFGTAKVSAYGYERELEFVSGKYTFLATKHIVFVILIYFPVQPVCNAHYRDWIVFC